MGDEIADVRLRAMLTRLAPTISRTPFDEHLAERQEPRLALASLSAMALDARISEYEMTGCGTNSGSRSGLTMSGSTPVDPRARQ
jgi:hypothetical protein